MTKYIFVVGGVMSGIGKGITTASIGRILKNRGYKVTALKIDPYINIDAGTMNPVEHGEVFVTDDGLECDQDIGNYERFLGEKMHKYNYMTTGSVYSSVIAKERNLHYKGKCVEVVPHIPEEVIERIQTAVKKTDADFTLIEIGGTVGEYQNLLFLEAGRMLKLKYPDRVIFAIVSYLPIPNMIGEMKTKPTQYAVRTLNSAGIQPDIIIARSEKSLDEPRKEKIAIFCNVNKEDVISAPDIQSIYEVPFNFEKEKLSQIIFKKFNIKPNEKSETPDVKAWNKKVKKINQLTKVVKVGIIGKYFASGKFTLADSYISVIEAIKHAGWHLGYNPKISWLDSETYEKDNRKLKELLKYNGIIVPGGFGSRGIEGKIKAIQFCRENKIPFLGLCYGMQLMAIEFARNVCGLKSSHTTEIEPKTPHPVIHLMEEQKELLNKKDYGGSMRLGAYECELKPATIAHAAYFGHSVSGSSDTRCLKITERHRHRYEFNNEYREQFEKSGMIFSGINPQKNLVEIMELNKKKHPFFVGCQFHPEFQSSIIKPHPLFLRFLKSN